MVLLQYAGDRRYACTTDQLRDATYDVVARMSAAALNAPVRDAPHLPRHRPRGSGGGCPNRWHAAGTTSAHANADDADAASAREHDDPSAVPATAAPVELPPLLHAIRRAPTWRWVGAAAAAAPFA